MLQELDRICLFNNLAGVEPEDRNINHPLIEDQLSFIEEEFKELFDAVSDNDRKEVVDALGDLLVVVGGALHRLGYDPKVVLRIVNDSNMSKFLDRDSPHFLKDCILTLEKYSSDDRYKNVYVDEEGVVYGIVKATGNKKILKGINYQEPDWSQIGL